MPGDSCLVCGNTRAKDPSISLYRFPKDQEKRECWLKALSIMEADIKDHHRVCSRHFPGGDSKQGNPQLSIGKRFASPKKLWTSRAKRARRREADRESPRPSSTTPNSSRQSTPCSSRPSSTISLSPSSIQIESASIDNDDQSVDVREMDASDIISVSGSTGVLSTSSYMYNNDTEVLVNTALISRIEMLEYFTIECIAGNDSLIKLYTGFTSYSIFLEFYAFLGSSVNELA